MAIAKFEAYQEAIEKIQSDMAAQTPGFRPGDDTENYQAVFLLGFMSKQNKCLIAILKKISQYSRDDLLYFSLVTEDLQDGFIQNMDNAVDFTRFLIDRQTIDQNMFLKRLFLYLAAFSLCVAILCFTAPIQIAMTIAFAMKAVSALILSVSSFAMGAEIMHYRKKRIPGLDLSIVKNWADDARITRSDDALRITVQAGALKSQFSTQTFFGQNKTLATLVEEGYQAKMHAH